MRVIRARNVIVYILNYIPTRKCAELCGTKLRCSTNLRGHEVSSLQANHAANCTCLKGILNFADEALKIYFAMLFGSAHA
jgi:hypothetical protein